MQLIIAAVGRVGSQVIRAPRIENAGLDVQSGDAPADLLDFIEGLRRVLLPQPERPPPPAGAAGIDRGRRKAHLHFFRMRGVEMLQARQKQRAELADGIGKSRAAGC